MGRRWRRRKSDSERLANAVLLAIILVVVWWTRNVGGLWSLVAVVALGVLGFFGIRWWWKQRALLRLADSGIDEVDSMSGEDFERFISAHFRRKGYGTKLTPKTADYGADLILEKDGRKVAVQAKRWHGLVGVGAVQEVLGAIQYYGADTGLVVTNSAFTENAHELAKKSPVELWSRKMLTQDLMKSGGRPPTAAPPDSAHTQEDPRYCPRCGNTLVVRSGKRGRFWGCSGFPKCRYTADI